MSRPSEMSVRPLTQEEQQWGERIYHQTTDVMLKTRCQIILLSLQRYSVPQLAALVFSSEDMVADTIHAFNRAGLQGIIPEPKGGRPPKRTAEFLKKLLEVVEGDPRDLGTAFSSWTAGWLAAVLKEPLELEVSESCMRRALHQQSYTIQRPVLTVSSPDPEDEQKCLLIEELQRRAQAGEIDLYYEDEVDLALLPGVMRGFSQRDHQRKIETPRHNKKRYGAGLIHWISGKLSWVVSERHPTMFCFARCSPTWSPRRKNQAGSLLVRRMWSWIRIAFTRAKAAQAWLAEHTDEVELVCLPTSSPQLNPVERFWKHLRRRVTHNHPFHTLDRLVEAVQDFFCDMAANPDVIRQVAGLAA